MAVGAACVFAITFARPVFLSSSDESSRSSSDDSVSRMASAISGQAEYRFPRSNSALARARDVILSTSNCVEACRYSSISSGEMGSTQKTGAICSVEQIAQALGVFVVLF